MTGIFLLSLLLQVLTPEVSWQIRSGATFSSSEDQPGPLNSISILVASGRIRSAEKYWNNPSDPPATRYDLLSALAWNGRYQLVRVVPDHPVPLDIAGTSVADKCAAICTLGWMAVREDGLFHGEDIVSKGDIVTLSQYVSALDPSLACLFLSDLENLFP